MYGFDDSDEPGRARLLGAAALAIVVIAALGWFILRPALTNDETAVPSASGSDFEFRHRGVIGRRLDGVHRSGRSGKRDAGVCAG